jgi:ABC-type transport system substrate-binding protein
VAAELSHRSPARAARAGAHLARVVRALVVALSALIVVGSGTRAAAESRPRYGGAIVGGVAGAPVGLDPTRARGPAEVQLIELLFDRLYQIGPGGAVLPRLAAGPPVIDGNVAHIPVRPGLTSHDGSALGPADVVASLQRLRTSPAGWLLAGVGDITALGDGVRVELDGPTPDLAARLAVPMAAITRRGQAPTLADPAGTGPFRLARLDRTRRVISLTAFADHALGRPYVDTLTLGWFPSPDGEARRFETGAAHVSLGGATAFAGHAPKFAAAELQGPASVLVYVGFGRAHPAVLAHREFRRALDLALPRAGLAAVGGGERIVPTTTPIPLELGGDPIDDHGRAGDLDGARAALRLAGAAVPDLAPAGLPSLRLEIGVAASRPGDREVAERVVRALDKLGIAAVVTDVEDAALRQRIEAGTLDLYIDHLPALAVEATLLYVAAFEAGGDDWGRAQLRATRPAPAVWARAWRERRPILPLLHRGPRAHVRTDVRGAAFDGLGRLGWADLSLWGKPERSGGTRQP